MDAACRCDDVSPSGAQCELCFLNKARLPGGGPECAGEPGTQGWGQTLRSPLQETWNHETMQQGHVPQTWMFLPLCLGSGGLRAENGGHDWDELRMAGDGSGARAEQASPELSLSEAFLFSVLEEHVSQLLGKDGS